MSFPILLLAVLIAVVAAVAVLDTSCASLEFSATNVFFDFATVVAAAKVSCEV